MTVLPCLSVQNSLHPGPFSGRGVRLLGLLSSRPPQPVQEISASTALVLLYWPWDGKDVGPPCATGACQASDKWWSYGRACPILCSNACLIWAAVAISPLAARSKKGRKKSLSSSRVR